MASSLGLDGVGYANAPEGGLLWLSVLPVLMGGRKQIGHQTAVIGLVTLAGLTVEMDDHGAVLPNTFYAKAQSADWAQGWLYIQLFFQMYWFVPLGWFSYHF